jgi:D-alanyl-lipoteichoic acid acyltransferase DltB (MBOAT superfamily)
VEFLSLIALSTCVDFYVANTLEKIDSNAKRTRLLWVSILTNLGLLFFFKYGSFVLGELLPVIPIPGWRKEQILRLMDFDLPVGISFYTFQTLGYTIDVYRRNARAEKHLGKFALYVSYFPQLVAGPIERFSHLQPQILAKHDFKYSNFSAGFRLMLYGFFCKMVIADNLAPIVDQVFEAPQHFSWFNKLIATAGFGWQIYADFYGYSLIAIGVAKCMGIELMDNFKTPYFSTSIQEFWRRWHISLSTWFRDYVFFPLGGSRVQPFIWARNILIVFVVSGFWHGANYTFLVWGGIHGAFYLLEKWTPKLPVTNWINGGFGWLKTYVIVSVAWIYFRAPNMGIAGDMIYGLFSNEKALNLDYPTQLAIAFPLFLLLEFWFKQNRPSEVLQKVSPMVRWTGYTVLLFLILGFAGTTQHPFIYFQF